MIFNAKFTLLHASYDNTLTNLNVIFFIFNTSSINIYKFGILGNVSTLLHFGYVKDLDTESRKL